MKRFKYFFILLTFILILVAIFAFSIPGAKLRVIACDVGQGDAILATYKNIQILTDGGPGNSVISCLGRYIPFWDRTIELVVSTHPDADHSTGLVEVLKRYTVANILINPIDSGTQTIKALEKQVGSKGITQIKPQDGQSIVLGLIRLDIVNPSMGQVLGLDTFAEESDLGYFKPVDPTNDYSISYVLRFGNFSGLFTGDIGNDVSDRIAEYPGIDNVDYIKIPHHGSKNGTTENLLKSFMPKVAVISVGKNSYGHPNRQILDLLNKYGVTTYRTDLLGDVILETDGKKWGIK